MLKLIGNFGKNCILRPSKVAKKNITTPEITKYEHELQNSLQKGENINNKIINKLKTIYELAKYKFKVWLYTDCITSKGVRNAGKKIKTTFAQRIKGYIRRVVDNNIDPRELDKRLTAIVGKNNVVEVPFIPNPEKGITIGRKKIFKFNNGKEIVLECHNDTIRNRNVVRIYDNAKYKQRRSYLTNEGNLHEDEYYSSKSHLLTGASGVEWMNESRISI